MGVNPLNDSYEYTTKSGLKVIYVYKKDFYKSYAGIGVKFGSADLEYYAGQEKVLSKEGLAHAGHGIPTTTQATARIGAHATGCSSA